MSTGEATVSAVPRHAGGRAWLVVAVLGSLWVIAHAARLIGPLEDATFLLLGTVAVVSTILGLRWHRPAVRWPWRTICAALILFLFGGAARVALGTLGDLSPGRSLTPDLLTLPGYLLVAVGLVGLSRSRRDRSSDVDAVLDGVVTALAALTFAWVFFINPVLSQQHVPQAVRLLLAAYPTMSVFLVAVTARLAFSAASRRSPARLALLAGMSAMLIGDIVYMLVDAHLATLPLTVIDVPYAAAYLGFAVCVLHPSMAEICRPAEREEAVGRPRLAFIGIAFAVPAFVTVSQQDVATTDRIVLSMIILALTATGIVRVVRALVGHARAEARLAHQATHDDLTGLPNRTLAEIHVSKALRRASTAPHSVALLFLDVDRFKLVNDTLGHTHGDELLVAVARRLKKNLRSGDFLARIGGDEFIILLDEVTDAAEAVYLADALRLCLHAPFIIRESEMFASASIGVSFTDGSDPSVDAETLIREADTAMYEAKETGRDATAVFDTSMRDVVAERLALEGELRHALKLGQLSVEFQPVVSLDDTRPVGLEALVRWRHPTLGAVGPAKFIPVAEDSGLIVEIGRWVLGEACRQLAGWRRAHPHLASDLYVAVNLSARQLREPTLVDMVLAALDEHGLPPDALRLELTESLLMDNAATATQLLELLRAIGVGLAIDDFGTGYSSLAYLKRFAVDEVKIDRTFVEGLDRDDSSEESLVTAIIAMAGALGLTTVAEGVETAEQERRLRLLGADRAQGYRYARPVSADRVPAVLAQLRGLVIPEALTLVG